MYILGFFAIVEGSKVVQVTQKRSWRKKTSTLNDFFRGPLRIFGIFFRGPEVLLKVAHFYELLSVK